MTLHFPFDFKHPDYAPVFARRIDKLQKLRAAIKAEGDDPQTLPGLFSYYRENPWQFITDWGVTFEPRNVELELPSIVPFLLFPKQEEWCRWLVDHWRARKGGLTEKSRDGGLSWLAVSMASTMCLFNDGMVFGFGSRKEEYVDKLDGPKSLFYKARLFIRHVPREFRQGWDSRRDAPYMRIKFPATNSYMTGEAGDNIGRGDRTGIYMVDEAAHLEHPELVDASLSATTNCRIDISSANGTANSFYQRRKSLPAADVFTFHWRDDPRKDDAWYAKQVAELPAVVVAQEIDIDYTASTEGIIIPSAWVQSAINAHVKLGITPTGAKTGALDIADEGADLNCFATKHGVVLRSCEAWSGKGSDIHASVEKAFLLADLNGVEDFCYDADGVGADGKGAARVINARRKGLRQPELNVTAFRGSGGVVRPKRQDVPGRTNEDFFANLKAQSWWALRTKFLVTHRAVTEGAPFDPDEIISIDGSIKQLGQLVMELSQPTYTINSAGKIVVDKTPDGAKSPNHGDGVMMLYSPYNRKTPGFF